jgi:Putative beta-barrel porin-2, OmpL-like. bbp2
MRLCYKLWAPSLALFSVIFNPISGQKTDSLATPTAPFEGMDLTWINGQNRQKNFPLTVTDKSTGETILTAGVYVDSYFNYNTHNPVDHSQLASSTLGRHQEFTLNHASFGIESNYKNIIGRLWMHTGNVLNVMQDNDPTVKRGQNMQINNLKYIREAAAGYHFNQWHGLNVEMGIFSSYVGLESFLTQENWSYQRSMVSDLTPFYFSGLRLQAFPTAKYKVELLLVNGWQTYSSWNNQLGLGCSNYYRPSENLQLAGNLYLGKDSKTNTQRFHHDHSVVARYYQSAANSGISQAAFSFNGHYGLQWGDDAKTVKQYMLGGALAHRLWFAKNRYALTMRADAITNPGLYLAFDPSPIKPNAYTDAVAADPKQILTMMQFSSTFDVMLTDYVTFRLEYLYRQVNKPYFAGPGGVTSPDGWQGTPTDAWRPDLKTYENRFLLAFNFRL